MTTSADRVQRQCAYLLHTKAYRETSALLDLLTPDYGRVRGVARGIRQPRSKRRETLCSFQTLSVDWRGKSDLKTIHDGEAVGLGHHLPGRSLWCGMYLNELLVRLLPLEEPCPRLFALYRFSLERLADTDTQEAVLRIFERRLLEELGFGVNFDTVASGAVIEPSHHYLFDPQRGFYESANERAPGGLFSGTIICAIADDNFSDPQARRAAKSIMRQALQPHLGAKPLKSRELFKRQIIGSGVAK